jgi:hypothetical protein
LQLVAIFCCPNMGRFPDLEDVLSFKQYFPKKRLFPVRSAQYLSYVKFIRAAH